MSNSVFGKTMENVRKHRDIKLVATDKERNQLVSEPNYLTTKWFSEKLLSVEMKKIKVRMNTVCSYHVTYAFQSESTLYPHSLPECQGTPCSKQARNLKFE